MKKSELDEFKEFVGNNHKSCFGSNVLTAIGEFRRYKQKEKKKKAFQEIVDRLWALFDKSKEWNLNTDEIVDVSINGAVVTDSAIGKRIIIDFKYR